MRQAKILYKDELAGILTQHDDGSFTYRYDHFWIADPNKPSISLTMPKSFILYRSESLFPFFFNMLPEGYNKQVMCQSLQIDQDDYFGLLLNTGEYDTIGAVTVHRISEPV